MAADSDLCNQGEGVACMLWYEASRRLPPIYCHSSESFCVCVWQRETESFN